METNLLMCNCAGSQWVTLERTNGQEIEGRAGESESEILRTLMLCCEVLLGWFSRCVFLLLLLTMEPEKFPPQVLRSFVNLASLSSRCCAQNWLNWGSVDRERALCQMLSVSVKKPHKIELRI